MNNIKKTFFNLLFSVAFSCQFLMGMDPNFREHVPVSGISDYASALPQIMDIDTSLSLEERIVQFLCRFSCGQAYLESGHEKLAAKVRDCMERSESIKLLIVSFAVKSCNEDTKIIQAGTLDFAEYIGLFTLEHMCQQIKSIYQPGAKVTIYTREVQTDYANMIIQQKLGTNLFPEPERCAYQYGLATLVACCFPSLEIGGIENIEECYAQAYHTFTRAGKALTEQDQRSIAAYATFWSNEFDCDRFKGAAFKKLGFISSTKKQRQAQQNTAINKLLKETAQDVAQCLLIGGKVMRTVLERHVPHYGSFIRLSVRAPDDGNISNKLGISLVYGSSGTPWHGALVISGIRVRLMSIKEINRQQECGHMYRQENIQIAGVPLVYYAYAGYENPRGNGLDYYA